MMAIQDPAKNPLSLPATGQMLGYVAPMPEAEVLPLSMYEFLIEPIRDLDRKEGALLVRRFCEGPQEIWDQNTARTFALKDLWSTTDCPDEFLPYLKNIVGWTQELITKRVTDALDSDTLRRLIAVSAPLWKRRGTEPSIIEFLTFLTEQRLRIWNWFDLRWILGETELTWDGLRADSWLTGSPEGPEGDDRRFNIRIVDPGTLDHALIRNVVNLMRASGERIEVSYISFLDEFTEEGDDSQWDQKSGTSMDVAGGAMSLSDDTGAEHAVAEVRDSYDWAQYMVFSRIKATGSTPYAGLLYYYTNASNYYWTAINCATSRLVIGKLVGGAPTTLADIDLKPVFGDLQPGLNYMLRTTILLDGSTNRIKAHLDGTEITEVTDGAHSLGTIGLWHDSGAAMVIDEVEAALLPMTTEEVGINY